MRIKVFCLGMLLSLPLLSHYVFAQETKQNRSQMEKTSQQGASRENSPAEKIKVYRLTYQEREPGVEPYEVRILVSRRYLRIDETDEDSGFIIYDDSRKTIYSTSHFDKRTLVIKQHDFSVKNSGVDAQVEYLQLADAPSVSGKNLFNYRITTGQGKKEETCADLQIVEGLLPEVTDMLKKYQQVISGQQVRMLPNTIEEVKTACYLVDQIYNEGLYYDKGLPVQEWHSNEKSKMLINYEQIEVDKSIFDLPKGYAEFSIDRSQLSR